MNKNQNIQGKCTNIIKLYQTIDGSSLYNMGSFL
jgi:hypothetical protein